MIGDSLKNIFDPLGCAYDFAFCQNDGSLKISQNVFWNKSFKNVKRYQSFGGSSNKVNIFWGSVGPNLRICRSSRKLRYEKIILFKVGSIFFLYVLKCSGDKQGAQRSNTGLKKVKVLELPKIIQKVLEYVRGP